MSSQQPSNTSQVITIQLEIVPEDEQQPDIADVEEVGRECVDYLRSNGYIVEPTYTGTKGNPIFDIVVQVYNVIHDNKELLAAAFTTASIVLQYLIKERDKRAEEEKAQRPLLEITLYVNGKAVSPDAEISSKLVEQHQGVHPEGSQKVNPQNSVKIRVRVSKKQRHHRR
jgi:hypothetical protein